MWHTVVNLNQKLLKIETFPNVCSEQCGRMKSTAHAVQFKASRLVMCTYFLLYVHSGVCSGVCSGACSGVQCTVVCLN